MDIFSDTEVFRILLSQMVIILDAQGGILR